MTRIRHMWVLCLISALAFIACSSSDVKAKAAGTSEVKGDSTAMIIHTLGRFSLAVPANMKLDGISQRLRNCDLREFVWQQTNNHERERMNLWNSRIAEIEKQKPPEDVKSSVIGLSTINNVGKFAKAVFYYGDDYTTERANRDLLLDTGPTGVWLKYRGDISKREAMLEWIVDIAKHHVARDSGSPLTSSSYGMQHGAIVLPYIYQESTFARFEGHPLDLILKIDMTETHTDEPKDAGLLARTAAAILTGFAMGVDIDRIRSGKREVAGLKGEEQVVRMSDKDGTEFDFTWRYAGKKESGEHPKIVITMESPDGNLKEKLKIWDAILDSVKPLYKKNP